MKPIKPSLYDPLKFVTQIVLPALGTLYFALAGIWGLPSAEQVVGTIVAVDTFLGVVLQLSSTAYKNSDAQYDGMIDVVESEGKTGFTLNLEGSPHDIPKMKEVRFKVNPPRNNA
jgi:hypothetical protein